MKTPPPKTILEAAGLTKRYESRARPVLALDEVDLALRAGEFVSVIGPSGCGKSTLLNILAGLDEPTGGTVRLDGEEHAPRLGQVGYMPQSDLLMPWRSVLDNIVLGPEIAGANLEEARRQARELLPRFGLEGFEHSYPDALSDGMRHRAALLRTFLAGRGIIVMDEPFGSLDSLTRAAMQQWLLQYWSERRPALLLVTHDVDEAIYLSDRVYVLSPRPGRIIYTVEVNLPRPRDHAAVVTSEHFISLKKTLLEKLLPQPAEAELNTSIRR